MEKHAKQLHVRMSQGELDRARRLAGMFDMTLSDLIRVLTQLPVAALSNAPNSLIVIDCETAAGLRREMRRWGYHYNQAVHALNAIAYYLRLNEMDECEVLEELNKVSCKVESMNNGVSLLREEVDELSTHPILFL